MKRQSPSSLADSLIGQFDRALRALSGASTEITQPNPAAALPEAELIETQRRHAAGLMRVNHTGEICAQALYQGQALTAKLSETRAAMDKAAMEEVDHLAWCEERLRELHSRPSFLNPLWYGLSLAMGAAAGAVGDKVSLGFVAATEDRVCEHLRHHLKQLPEADLKSRAIIEKMLDDEARHAQQALEAGGYRFPTPVKFAMAAVARVMTQTSYRF